MLGLPILETALGLMFVFLLFSLLISTVNEIICGHLTNLRAKTLRDGLQSLLAGQTDDSAVHSSLMARKVLQKLKQQITRTAGEKKRSSEQIDETIKLLDSLRGSTSGGNHFVARVLTNPLITSLSKGSQKSASYIPPKVFADAVLAELLKDKFEKDATAEGPVALATVKDINDAIHGLKDDPIRELLQALLIGHDDIAQARARIEKWFDDAMERITGVYRRKTQALLYLWASLVALLLNVDTIEITKRLLVDSNLRQSLAKSAENAATNQFYRAPFTLHTNLSLTTNRIAIPGQPSQSVAVITTNVVILSTNALRAANQIAGDIAALRLPIGWEGSANNSNAFSRFLIGLLGTNSASDSSALITLATVSSPPPLPRTNPEWLLKLLGLFLTICAVSQGAPFWFDLLNRVTNLRAAGPRPAPSAPPRRKP